MLPIRLPLRSIARCSRLFGVSVENGKDCLLINSLLEENSFEIRSLGHRMKGLAAAVLTIFPKLAR